MIRAIVHNPSRGAKVAAVNLVGPTESVEVQAHIDTRDDLLRSWREIGEALEGRARAKLLKDLRTARYHATRGPKSWTEVLPADLVGWARDKIEEMAGGLDCVDNLRVALAGNTGQERRYARQVKEGCCGSFDAVHRGPDGKLYRLGFNYGH